MKGELAAEIPAARHSSIPIPHTELLVEATQVEYCLEAGFKKETSFTFLLLAEQ